MKILNLFNISILRPYPPAGRLAYRQAGEGEGSHDNIELNLLIKI